MSYVFYKILHLLCVISLFASLGALLALSASADKKYKKKLMILHGLASLVLLVSGFGLLARLGIFSTFPLWAVGKMLVWGLLAFLLPVLISKKSLSTTGLWVFLLLGGGGAVLLGTLKTSLL